MQALILAAGMGKRLGELTQNNTKCMVRVNGVTLIERLLRQLETLRLSKIVLVVGYEGQKLKGSSKNLPRWEIHPEDHYAICQFRCQVKREWNR